MGLDVSSRPSFYNLIIDGMQSFVRPSKYRRNHKPFSKSINYISCAYINCIFVHSISWEKSVNMFLKIRSPNILKMDSENLKT